jgi:hypothetical protein
MMKTILMVLLSTLPVLAQDQAVTARAAAGCGPTEVKFEVKTDKRQHPIGQPESGKALVYVFADENADPGGIRIGGLTTRIGLDGAWVGANKGTSYFFFSVNPAVIACVRIGNRVSPVAPNWVRRPTLCWRRAKSITSGQASISSRVSASQA